MVWSQDREALLRVLMDSSSPVPTRVAAYLVLMKDSRPTELGPLLSVLATEDNPQFRSFVESHLINIVSSTEPETKEYAGISSSRTSLHVSVLLVMWV